MLRKLIENVTGELNDNEFATVCEMVTDDIKFNRIKFNKRTSSSEMLAIAERSVNVIKRCA
ncbi:hypothetical protein [Clostridium sp. DL1XJH146]